MLYERGLRTDQAGNIFTYKVLFDEYVILGFTEIFLVSCTKWLLRCPMILQPYGYLR
jgi:hypothetical protein